MANTSNIFVKEIKLPTMLRIWI